jgi:Fe-S cluster biogenesis protein NfuA
MRILAVQEKIEQIIENDINPFLAMHAGGCEFVTFEEGILTIRMFGGCSGCPSSQLTLFNGIIPIFKEKMPEIQDILLE